MSQESFLHHERIHTILVTVIHASCRLTPAQTQIFPSSPTTRNGAGSWTATHPMRSVSIRPATSLPSTSLGSVIPSQRRLTGATSRGLPSLEHVPPYALPHRPLQIAKLCGELATGTKAFRKVGYSVASCTWAVTDPYAHVAVSRRLS
jgi:hypothetical protein